MSEGQIPKWILIVSALFALLEISVSFLLYFSPQSVAESVDLGAKGVGFLINMWAVRQFALGFILAFSTVKKSKPMLTVSYIFLLIMFLGDLLIGVAQQELSLAATAVVMSLIAAALLFAINRGR